MPERLAAELKPIGYAIVFAVIFGLLFHYVMR